MERMKKEKESWTLLWVWTAYLPVKEIKWEFYVKVSDFTRCMDSIRIEQEADRKHIEQLEEENKKLKERINVLYEFIERNDKLVDEVIDEEDLDKLNRYIYIDDDLVDRTLESED